MDILDEIQEDVKKEKLLSFFQNYGKYLVAVILACFIFTILYFWWSNYKSNLLLEDSSEYNDAINSKEQVRISKLEKIKQKNSVYGDLAKLQLAAYYYDDKDYNKSIHNYELIYKSKSSSEIYRDYAKLMAIKIRVHTGKISLDDGIKLYEDFYKDSKYFKNIAVLGESILLLNKGNYSSNLHKINEILTDNEAPNLLLYLAKTINKRLS